MAHGGLLLIAMGALLYIASWGITATADHDATPSLNSHSQEERVEVAEASRPFRALTGVITMIEVADWASSDARFAPRPNP